MAGHGYMTTGYSSYNNGAVSPAEEHSRLGYVEYECIGDVCRPITGVSDRRNQPIAFHTSPTSKYFVKTERIIERVRAPLVDYDNHFTANDYGGDRRYRPEPYDVDHDRRFPTNDYGDRKYKPEPYDVVHDDRNFPTNVYGDHRKYKPEPRDVVNDGRKFPTSDYGDRRYRPAEPYDQYDVDHDRRPPKVDEFFTNVQNDVAQPIGGRYSATSSNTKWPASSASPADFTGLDSSTQHGFSITKLDNPRKDQTIRSENNYQDQPWKSDRIITEPASLMSTTGINRPNMPNRVRLAAMARKQDSKTKLSAPTSDITTAMEHLMWTAKPSDGRPAAESVLKNNSTYYSDSLDRHEVADRYGNFRLSSRPFPVGQRYVATSK